MVINPVSGTLGEGGSSSDSRLASLDVVLAMMAANISIFASCEENVLTAADEISALIASDPESEEIAQKFKELINMLLSKITEEYYNLCDSGDILQGGTNDSTIASITAKLQAINSAINADPTNEDISVLLQGLIDTLKNTSFVLLSDKLAELDSIFNSLNATLASDVRSTYLSIRSKLESATTITDAEEAIKSLSNYSTISNQTYITESEKAQQTHIGGVLMKLKMAQTTNQLLELAAENEAYKRLEEAEVSSDTIKRTKQEGLIANMNPTTEEYNKTLEENAEKIKKEKKIEL